MVNIKQIKGVAKEYYFGPRKKVCNYRKKKNEKLALNFGIEKVGIQRPRRKLDKPPDNPATDDDQVMLANRRSGIEPLIGHLKRHRQMGRSRMKKDSATESSGYCPMLGFNLRQLIRYLSGDTLPSLNRVTISQYIHKKCKL